MEVCKYIQSSSCLSELCREHVLRDLRPYTCTYAECSTGDQLYDEYKTWSAQELNYHNRSWKCFDHPNEPFSDAKSFRQHLSACQGYDGTDSRLDALVAASTAVAQTPNRCCPFCGFEADSMSSMQSHIAIHQQRVVLFALPNSTGLEEGSDVGSAEADAGHISGESDMSKNIEAWNPLSDNVATVQNSLNVDFSLLEGLQVDNTGRIPSTRSAPDAVIVGQALPMSTRAPSSYFNRSINKHGHIQNSHGRIVGHAGLWPRDLCVVAHSNYTGKGYAPLRYEPLQFAPGEVIAVLCQAPTGWWYGARKAHRGWFPSSYISPASSDAVESADNEHPIKVPPVIVLEAPPVQDPPNWAAEFGLSGFFTACLNGNKDDITNFLRVRPESANMLNDAGDTPLHIVAERGYVDIVHSLLSQRAEVDSRNRTQATPLMGAVENGQLEVVRGLLSYGANAQLQDSRGHTPLEFFLLRTPGGPEVRSMIRELLVQSTSGQLLGSRAAKDPNMQSQPDERSLSEQRKAHVQDEIDKEMRIKLGTESMLRALEGQAVKTTKGRKHRLEQELEASSKKLAELNLELDDETYQAHILGSPPSEVSWIETKFDAAVDRATEREHQAKNGILLPHTREIRQMLDAEDTPEPYEQLAPAMAKCLTVNSVLAPTKAVRTLDLADMLIDRCGLEMSRELIDGAWIESLCTIYDNPGVGQGIKAEIIKRMRQWSANLKGENDVRILQEALRKFDDESSTPDRSAKEAESESRPLPPLPTIGEPSGNVIATPSAVAHFFAESKASPYPWSRWQLPASDTGKHSLFPRYGAGINNIASKDGDVYIFGGLTGGSTVRADAWLLNMKSRTCAPLTTTDEGPGPRVGHVALLVGNALIVLGGETKVDESDEKDATLYLMNISNRQWSHVSRSVCPKMPPPRYGHTMCVLGSCLYVFGGQEEGTMYNDTWYFDLNKLSDADKAWEQQHPSLSPPARTNHTAVTYKDEMWIFGGTDGVTWYNDIWKYNPKTDDWMRIEDVVGYIPASREGHSSAVVEDVMYVFGGRTEAGTDLADLCAYRCTPHNRWYTFQNMGLAPSARSGHAMTVGPGGSTIFVIGGEPNSAPRDREELQMVYELNTRKVRYPDISTAQRETLGNSATWVNQAVSPSAANRSVGQATDRKSISADPESRSAVVKRPRGKATEKGGSVVKSVEKFFRRRGQAETEAEPR